MALKSFITLTTAEVELMKLFWYKITHTFWKLSHFINANNNSLSAEKRSNLQTRVNKFTLKMFFDIDSWSQTQKTFFRLKFTHSFLKATSLHSTETIIVGVNKMA